MAKRRAAEPLAFRVPWKRLLLSDFPEEPPVWVQPSGAARPRKRQGDAGTMAEPAAAPRKRRGGGDGGQELQGCGLEPGEPPPDGQEEPRVSRAPGGGDGVEGAGSLPGAVGAHSQVGPTCWTAGNKDCDPVGQLSDKRKKSFYLNDDVQLVASFLVAFFRGPIIS